MNLFKAINNGKNPKWKYYLKNYLRLIIPNAVYQSQLQLILENAAKRDDYEYILERVNYYNQLDKITPISEGDTIKDLKLKEITAGKVYFFDTREILRYFPANSKIAHWFGDVTEVPKEPAIVKSRPIVGDIRNSIVLKLDKVRHFIYTNDQIPFTQKKNIALFRGKVANKRLRQDFFQQFFNHPMCDLGDTERKSADPDEWKVEKITIAEQLKYKFILALEGHDVASNLKWVMSSNSLAVMPPPVYETWFMEGKLIPNVHYVAIKPDFSDLEERLNYYIDHPEEAHKIIDNANQYVEQFKDEKREKIISLLVLKKYFEKTNKLQP
ncbi:MAG: glycosyl transferase family 90 [Bacteroidota bacterium]